MNAIALRSNNFSKDISAKEIAISLSVVRRLEQEFPPFKDTDCQVGIGVATGGNRVFIGLYDRLNVEAERKLPLTTTHGKEGFTRITIDTIFFPKNGI
ncbi:hypothetical protein [Geitlerinema sp. PCC 9228]|uniref:hypothetical protein n=1 Tax=Geitlerinema sp. PCC 9228 TaxID=111611 RepID=UPI0008F9C3BB|nr:hypothetical protein [Geitlerinema sp. PCC 9228]